MTEPFPVNAAEVAALTQESRRLNALGAKATAQDRCAYFEQQVGVLERIALYGAVMVDRRTVDGALVYARGQLEHFRELTGQAGARDA
jgi:hypothetical protein